MTTNTTASSSAPPRFAGHSGSGLPEAIGQSDAFLEFQDKLSAAARVDRPVLIVGERGTGKELAAARLHFLSRRWGEALVALNCAALAPSLIESELFGYEPGAFTGATSRRAGRFEAAHSGTLFLDEIGLIPLPVQEKILRAVEYQSFERVGGTEPIRVDVRIVGATNADLGAMARAGKFKRDLLDRLCFEVLFIPPLRERREDILLLARHFAARMAVEMGLAEVPDFSPLASEALEHHPWPGNIRELKNAVERAVYRGGGETVEEIDFEPLRYPFGEGLETPQDLSQPTIRQAPALPGAATPEPPGLIPGEDPSVPIIDRDAALTGVGSQTLAERIAALEIAALKSALARAGRHQGRAAELLGLSYHQFRRLLKKHQSAIPELRPPQSGRPPKP